MSRRVVRFFVTGRVQGVGFRAFLIRQANALGLVGWARNCRDGSVEALAAGPEEKVAALITAARRGPLLARVESLREAEADFAELGDGTGFTVGETV
ncbi:acylphosphatase [Methylocystis sp. Sn-Cys]|uniref:acylphosphatase n=1 Tax=Methylocystis sp. Sn-Cys TaxID=1701263 RepID=UPI0019207B7F|nr:acylphosphatase [Methylocystis sp. Sn-Cys]MBL1257996.1 acylphosphatase [Methylocystis sp. Sn-Cys]